MGVLSQENAHEADFPKALMALSPGDRIKVLRDIWKFLVLYKEFKWGRKIAALSMQRLLRGDYSQKNWL